MKKKQLTSFLCLATAIPIVADTLPADSIRTTVDMEEIVVIASPKENSLLRELPTSVTELSQKNMRSNQVTSLKSLNALVPNIFIPDYGSRLTSAIYIRGIGSRINTPSVGLYVDNVPYIDKSAFDFNYSDIERIDVLRGPQSTLYGRNTMGGLIHVHTKSPFTYQGTDVRLNAGNYHTYEASLTHYHRISDRFAFSVGGFYEYNGGFFQNNALNNQKADQGMSGGGRIHGILLPSDNLKLDLNISYEYTNQGGYPYFYLGRVSETEQPTDPRADKIGSISYNEESTYRRSMLNSGFTLEYQADQFILSAVTGYQHLGDRMFLDQDFTEADIFNLEQKQRLNTISEEIMLKAKPGKRWQWTTGAFGFYQWLHTDGPVTFKRDGIESIIENNANSHFPNSPMAPTLKLSVHNPSLYIGGDFDTPILGAAVYHQSTLNDLFIQGLSASVGLRLDYEKNRMNYSSVSDPLDFNFTMRMESMGINLSDDMKAPASIQGKLSNDYLQLLPKFSLQYKWNHHNVYATVSRGYRSGGYNIQMFSELAQTEYQRSMMQAIKDNPKFDLPMMGDMIDKMIDKMMPPEPDVEATTIYRPEYSWNYEAGAHLSFFNSKLNLDLAAFYMDTRDQQVAKFSENGLGRITVNAGKSRSTGAELSLQAQATPALSFQANYGFTHATFTEYLTNEKGKNGYNTIDYSGNYVPFVPQHTFNVGAQYLLKLNKRYWLERIQFNANYNAAAKIYWTESNNAHQDFYGTLNGRVSFEKGPGSIALWIRNALNSEYTTFYFESMGNRFMQKGKPLQCGIELRCRF